MSFEFLFRPVEEVDAWLEALFAGAPFLFVLVIALLLGLRHASDPDHLVAVTSLVAADGGDTKGAARLGAWWGVGHAAALLAIGLPLILFKAGLPATLESGAETAVGVVILVLAGRVVLKWLRGDFRASRHRHAAAAPAGQLAARTGSTRHRHLHHPAEGREHPHRRVRTAQQAFAIGLLHGLAGSGALVLLLIAALPSQAQAAAALAVFAPMSVISMALCTTAFAWLLTRPIVDPIYRTVLVPAFGLSGLMFGAWYLGI
jgi:ABC-type nickel/cobalt efflux system permease component RcnA